MGRINIARSVEDVFMQNKEFLERQIELHGSLIALYSLQEFAFFFVRNYYGVSNDKLTQEIDDECIRLMESKGYNLILEE